MGICRWDGEGWYKANQRWLLEANTRAAEFGFPEAQNELGIRFYEGVGVERNREAALDWFEKAAAQGNAAACYNLGVCHAYGQPSEINYSAAVDYFKWAANLGSLEAARALVDFYSPAKWTQKDVHEVVKWFRMLCRRNPKAMEMKRPVSPQYQDDPEYYDGACYWLGIASDAGVKEAQYFEARSDYDGVIYERSLGSDARFAADRERKARRAFALFRSSSESGWLPSLKCLGDCYMEAVGVEKNISEAVRLYRLGAEKGYAPAQKALADIYYDGDAVEKDLQKAIGLYENAASQGNANAQYFLGLCYFTGDGVEKDMGKAWMLLTRAAYGRVEEAYEVRHVVETLVTPQERAKWDEGRRMNPFSRQHSLDELRKWMYDNNYPIGYVGPYSRDYDWRKMAADLGNSKALCDFGVDLVENPTCDADWDRAFKLFTRAADLGEPSAFFNMGKCLMDGIGTEVDKVRALAWFKKACDSGYKHVQPLLADCYCDGIGCEADAEKAISIYRQNMIAPDDRPKQAFLGVKCHKMENGGIGYCFSSARRWIELMAEAGNAECQYEMGWELARRSDRWKEEEKSQGAFSWFRKAAEQGHAKAENCLGECYRDGHGVEADLSEAVRWFEKAAEQNNPDALFNLGFYYYAGNGVRRDWKKARVLFERAVDADKHGLRAGDKAKECLRNMGVDVQRTKS